MVDKETSFLRSTKGLQVWPPKIVDPRKFPKDSSKKDAPSIKDDIENATPNRQENKGSV